ncbi:hypothetical protein LJ739_07825 [Aestuariibacter halophilus]|uniref:Uncharacterized protein n=1 Tax=Fluctibacter halophilus TaxID=226011 RepID=A0ABS8G6M4_9ALTE|nr:hypothetical protein [Aestuariibacter halophilus]MCC2616144.1 hypothetical protein [Aestuariibacter halophilus]
MIEQNYIDARDQWREKLKQKNPANLELSRNCNVMMIVSGQVGVKAAGMMMSLPIGHLTVCPVLDTDIALIEQLEGLDSQSLSLSVLPHVFDVYGAAPHVQHHDFLVVATGRSFPQLLLDINALAVRLEMPWTQVNNFAHKITLGPTIIPGVTACYQCLTDRLASHTKQHDSIEAKQHFLNNNRGFEFKGNLPSIQEMTVSYLYEEVTRFIFGQNPPIAMGREVNLDTLYMAEDREFVPPMEWCRTCHFGSQATGQAFDAFTRRHSAPAAQRASK